MGGAVFTPSFTWGQTMGFPGGSDSKDSLSAFWCRRIRGLWKLPDGRDWLKGKLGLVLMGRAMLSKSLIQFSIDWEGCVPSLLFELRPNYGRGSEDSSDLLRKDLCTHCCIQCPWPCSRPLSIHLHQRLLDTPRKSGSVSCGVRLGFFPVVMYGYECWAIKKAEHWRTDAFELWCWRRLLRVPWTARASNQSILKEISPEYSSEGLMLRLNLQYFAHVMQRTDSGKDPDSGKDWRQEKGTTEDEMVGWHHWLDGHEFEQTLGVGDGQGSLACCSPCSRKESDVTD